MNLLKYDPRDTSFHIQRYGNSHSSSHGSSKRRFVREGKRMPTPKVECSRYSYFSTLRSLNTVVLVFAALLIQRTILQLQADTTSPQRAHDYNCVIDTCNDDWAAIGGPGDTNIDTGKCNSIRHALKMSSLKPNSNITGHWCKVYLATKHCESKRYRYMIFRDDDTKIDVPKVLHLMTEGHTNTTALMASYRWRSKHLVTNWFVLDTHSQWACEVMRKWWSLAVRDHPEHDQKYFNQLVKCRNDNDNNNNSMLKCIDKYENLVDEVHCRSELGSFRSTKRQACMRYQVEFDRNLL